MSQETTKALNVVQEMLTAFGKGDMEALQKLYLMIQFGFTTGQMVFLIMERIKVKKEQ